MSSNVVQRLQSALSGTCHVVRTSAAGCPAALNLALGARGAHEGICAQLQSMLTAEGILLGLVAGNASDARLYAGLARYVAAASMNRIDNNRTQTLTDIVLAAAAR